ncbi:alpha/beta-hydrolase [Conidiobolus coronatus NRRL 28638]|uniref:Alpha/beta-hydrolase n=1 Tax=Conidiobolus coronatus (strain ATCC 28846 / CBS 209.66 / NRRL 28638) TaxID=796925 RepID=A0A137NWA9_CONC2|nr:alpha/beta-hydrolase [Conidiobolus coronatus NRRL 28638]|eukprot:KXN66919.1 alpha/beta-hydrolase [Conidiobolus coronatus NRRL 28638]
MLGETQCKSSVLEELSIHSKFRQKANELVNKHLEEKYGDSTWYDESCKPENSPPLKAELIIPNSMKLTSDSKVILFLHSGAYCFGDFSRYRLYMEELGQKTGCIVLGLNYRLAPEFSAPCQLEDALAIDGNENESGVGLSLNQIIIMGDSAGGGLCASLCHFLRDINFGKPLAAVLYSPWIDLVSDSYPSYEEFSNTDFLPPPINLIIKEGNEEEILDGQLKLIYGGSPSNIKAKILERGHYLAPVKYLHTPIISPLKDTNFSDLPPVLIITGDAEVIRDESIHYNDSIYDAYSDGQLAQRNISPCTLHLYPDMIHIFPMNFPFIKESKEALGKTAEFINRCFEENDN